MAPMAFTRDVNSEDDSQTDESQYVSRMDVSEAESQTVTSCFQLFCKFTKEVRAPAVTYIAMQSTSCTHMFKMLAVT